MTQSCASIRIYYDRLLSEYFFCSAIDSKAVSIERKIGDWRWSINRYCPVSSIDVSRQLSGKQRKNRISFSILDSFPRVLVNLHLIFNRICSIRFYFFLFRAAWEPLLAKRTPDLRIFPKMWHLSRQVSDAVMSSKRGS